jgi:hypothetical protein
MSNRPRRRRTNYTQYALAATERSALYHAAWEARVADMEAELECQEAKHQAAVAAGKTVDPAERFLDGLKVVADNIRFGMALDQMMKRR